MLAPLCGDVCACDYVFVDETAKDSHERFKELLDLDIAEDYINMDCEQLPSRFIGSAANSVPYLLNFLLKRYIDNILDVGSGKEDLLKSSVSHVTVSNAPSTTTISTDFDSDIRKTPSSISNGMYWYDRFLC